MIPFPERAGLSKQEWYQPGVPHTPRVAQGRAEGLVWFAGMQGEAGGEQISDSCPFFSLPSVTGQKSSVHELPIPRGVSSSDHRGHGSFQVPTGSGQTSAELLHRHP